MTFRTATFLDHAAIYVKDIDWHTKFFQEVFGLTIRNINNDGAGRKQVFFNGGIQLVHEPNFNGPEGRVSHLGIVAENRADVLEKAYAHGAVEMPQGHHWFSLPDGLCFEIIEEAHPGAVEAYGKVEVR